MSKHLEIGEVFADGQGVNAFRLPADAVTQTFAILAKRRVGKTYTASVMAEELVRLALPFVALDPTGAWWGLRATEAGKPNGSPVIIIGGEHGDVPLEATAGKVIAELVVENPGQYIIDLSGTNSNAEQDRFVCDFAERLYRLKALHKSPLHLFLDEADSFAPQKPMPGQQRMLGAIEALVRRGGIRGIGLTLISQRSAVLNKNVLTQTECLVVLQITSPQDIEAIDAWVKNHATPDQRELVIGSLASLPKGRAWFWSPGWLQCLVQVNVRKRTTYNSSATPEVGQKHDAVVKLAPADLDKIRDKAQATIEKVKAEDPRELKKEIAELKKERDTLKRELQTGKPAQIKMQIHEVPVLKEKEIKRLEKASITLIDFANSIGESAKAVLKAVSQAGLIRNVRPFPGPMASQAHHQSVAQRTTSASRSVVPQERVKHLAAAVPSEPVRQAAMRVDTKDGNSQGGEIDGRQQKILDVVAMLNARGLTPNRDMIARWLNLHPNGGSYGTNLGWLRAEGFLEGCELTEKGRAQAGAVNTGLDNARKVLDARLNKIIDLLEGGAEYDRDSLAHDLNLHPNGGSYGTNLGRLRTMGLIPERGTIKLTEAAFR